MVSVVMTVVEHVLQHVAHVALPAPMPPQPMAATSLPKLEPPK
jgi:hypothetical protein